MASQYGPSMQAFVGPQTMNRQDIARLTSFNQALLQFQRNVNAGLAPPQLDEICELYNKSSTLPGLALASWWRLSCTHHGRALSEPAVFEPMVTTWLESPSTAAGVIRFVVAELGPQFTAAEVQSQIAASCLGNLLDQEFLLQLGGLDSDETLDKDQLLEMFYAHHHNDLPTMPGELIERFTNDPPAPAPGSCAASYARLGAKAKAISDHRAFRAVIGILIIGVVLITGINTSSAAADGTEQTWMQTTEFVIIMVFVTEVLLKVVAEGLMPWRFFHINVKPGTAPYSPHGHWQWLFNLRHWLSGLQGWNIFDFVVVVICVMQQVAEQDNGNMVVLRMIRLIKVLQLFMEVDQIRAVLLGLAGGLHALIFILVVFSVIFYVYGLVGIHMFGLSDEFHFSNLGYAVTTMARMAMGPWQDVLFINLYGCLDEKANLGTPQIQEIYCEEAEHPGLTGIVGSDDITRRGAVLLYFITFKIVCGFVALSLLFGVITTAMSKALAESNKKKFEALRVKRQQGAHRQLLRRRNAARMEAEVDTVQRYSTKWWTISGKIEVKLEKIPGSIDQPDGVRRRRVFVPRATNLPHSDGTAQDPKPGDPYVLVFWNDTQIFKTDIVYNSVDPMWDESGIVLIPPRGGELRVEVFDWDADETLIPGIRRSDAFLGEATISLGKDSKSLGGTDCAPASKFYNLTHHVAKTALDQALLSSAAEVAAVSPEKRTPADLQAIANVLELIRWFQVNCPNPHALLQVAKCVKRKLCVPNEVLYDHGANARSMYIVLSGSVILQQPSGKVVARMGAGATLGERALMGDMDELMETVDDGYGSDSDQDDNIDSSRRYCTAVAISDAVVLRLTKEKFFNISNRRSENAGGSAVVTGWMYTYKKQSLKAFRLANEDWFHWAVLVCILIQAVVLGLETTVRNHKFIDEANKPTWAVVNVALRLIFTAEVIVKMLANLNPWQEWAWISDFWTLFDAIIVLMSWLPFTPEGLLMLRVLRLFRVLQEFNSLPQLKMIVNGLMDACSGLWFVVLLLALVLYFYSIIGLQMFGANDYRFGSLDSALLSLTSVATEGSWPHLMYTNMYGCRDYYTSGHRCCVDVPELGNDTTPFGTPLPPIFSARTPVSFAWPERLCFAWMRRR
eukprot:COSAG02_NODE_303_length_25213_cov_126.386199_16_plen_1132_part_00